MALVDVKDNPGLVRDTKSGAVICVDKNLINRSKEIRRLRKQKQQQVDNMQEQVDYLYNEISDIKRLIIQLIENKHG